MGQKTLAYNQIGSSALSAAVGLGDGLHNVATVTIVAAGTGYKVGDMLTVSGGTKTVAAVIQVTQITTAGAIVEAVIGNGGFSSGVYTSKPSNAVSVTGGAGTGATFNLTWNDDAVPTGATHCTLLAETNDVRFTTDGATTPTSSVGFLLKAASAGTKTDFLTLQGGDMMNCKVIAASGSPVLNVNFYKS